VYEQDNFIDLHDLLNPVHLVNPVKIYNAELLQKPGLNFSEEISICAYGHNQISGWHSDFSKPQSLKPET